MRTSLHIDALTVGVQLLEVRDRPGCQDHDIINFIVHDEQGARIDIGLVLPVGGSAEFAKSTAKEDAYRLHMAKS
jgi:hypothetical protein